jgi:hypothetical protein
MIKLWLKRKVAIRMKQKMKIQSLMAGLLVILAVVLFSCGGGGGYGGGGGGGGAVLPGMSSLSSPLDTMTGVGMTPTLTWSSATNATGYRVQVDTTVAFSAPIIDKTVNPTTYTVLLADGLQLGIVYHWRVIAENAYGPGTPSGTFSFTP